MENDIARERLREAIRRAGTTATELAQRIGRDRSYFRDFMNGKKQSLGAQALAQAAEILSVDAGWLSGAAKPKAAATMLQQSPMASTSLRSDPINDSHRRMIPLFGQAAGGPDGSFPFNGEVLAQLPCPISLERVANPYAVSLWGDSMEPRLRSGDTLHVNPSRSARRGDDVVVQVRGSGDEIWGYVKELVTIGVDKIVLRQLNPPKEITFPLDKVAAIHVVQLIER